jgi:hypothetical protein
MIYKKLLRKLTIDNTCHHDKTVILLKVAFNTINQTNPNQPALEGKKQRSSALEGKE